MAKGIADKKTRYSPYVKLPDVVQQLIKDKKIPPSVLVRQDALDRMKAAAAKVLKEYKKCQECCAAMERAMGALTNELCRTRMSSGWTVPGP
jgi:enterochelin esterase-like enzyme